MNSTPFAIKRVINRGGSYVCGICHNSHDTRESAEACLEVCLRSYYSAMPVIPVYQAGRASARCRFCGREYDRIAAANACAEECRAKFMGLRTVEKTAITLNLKSLKSTPSKSRFMTRPVLRILDPRQMFKKKDPDEGEMREVEAAVHRASDPVSTGGTSAKEASSAAPAPAASESAPAAAPVKKKEKKSDKFYREGANYVCSICGKKFFTKLEVVTCWDKHE